MHSGLLITPTELTAHSETAATTKFRATTDVEHPKGWPSSTTTAANINTNTVFSGCCRRDPTFHPAPDDNNDDDDDYDAYNNKSYAHRNNHSFTTSSTLNNHNDYRNNTVHPGPTVTRFLFAESDSPFCNKPNAVFYFCCQLG